MPRTDVVVEIDTPNSFRVAQVAGMFDVSLAAKVRRTWHVDLPLDDRPWSIGLIVGPSGCGKSTVAQALWPAAYVRGFDWTDASILDNFPAAMSGKAIVAALTAVGFSSPPDWVKPYHVLSTGQQMRADLARALCADGLVVFDEFTSVVDRTVAQIGSAALAKTVRKQDGRQFIAVTFHADVLEWLAPDWTYEPHTNTFAWRSLQRPEIELDIFRVDSAAWPLFAPYHYLSADLHVAAECYVAEWRGVPVGFVAVLPVIGFRNARRESRIVVLPDYQGIGIGSRLSTAIAQLYRERGMRYRSTTSHPGFIAHRNSSKDWAVAAQTKMNAPHAGVNATHSRQTSRGWATSSGRRVITWEYVGA
jgi:GNAT superfamily N-acetyltransferase